MTGIFYGHELKFDIGVIRWQRHKDDATPDQLPSREPDSDILGLSSIFQHFSQTVAGLATTGVVQAPQTSKDNALEQKRGYLPQSEPSWLSDPFQLTRKDKEGGGDGK